MDTQGQERPLCQNHPSGLMNMGNTCFLNTLLQCMLHTDPIRNYFINIYQKSGGDMDTKNGKDDRVSISYELGLLFYQLWVEKVSLLPRRFMIALSSIMPSYMSVGDQHDIGELWCWLADRIQMENRGVQEQPWTFSSFDLEHVLKTPDKSVIHFHKKCLQAWNQFHRTDSIQWTKIHEGLQVTQIVCKYDHVYHNYEPFTTITLDIPKDVTSTDLRSCFQEMFKLDVLNNDSQDWKCDHCKTFCSAERITRFWKTPDMLVIVLKRFEVHPNGMLSKNGTLVEIPLMFEFLDGTVLTNDRAKYRLTSVGNHYGSIIGGHYNCICKFEDNWWKVDDIHIEKLNNIECIEKNTNAYLLFYQRA